MGRNAQRRRQMRDLKKFVRRSGGSAQLISQIYRQRAAADPHYITNRELRRGNPVRGRVRA